MTPRRIFVDTGAWFATQVVDDARHDEAADTLRGLVALPVVLVTTKRAERIRHAFAFDSHFATAGFLRVPTDAGVEQLRASRA